MSAIDGVESGVWIFEQDAIVAIATDGTAAQKASGDPAADEIVMSAVAEMDSTALIGGDGSAGFEMIDAGIDALDLV